MTDKANDAIALHKQGLLCDACGHVVPLGRRPLESDIGTPCPECGADMLTRADYEAALTMFAGIDALNKLARALGLKIPDGTHDPAAPGRLAVSVNPRADGLRIRVETTKRGES